MLSIPIANITGSASVDALVANTIANVDATPV